VHRLRRDVLDILRGFAGGRRREDGDEVPPRRPPPDRHGGRRICDEEKARQAKNPPYETENHRAEGSETQRFERVFDKGVESEILSEGGTRARKTERRPSDPDAAEPCSARSGPPREPHPEARRNPREMREMATIAEKDGQRRPSERFARAEAACSRAQNEREASALRPSPEFGYAE
jgi:hypothetical protein